MPLSKTVVGIMATFLCLFLFANVSVSFAQTGVDRYVNVLWGSDSNTGESWTEAYKTIRKAIAESRAYDTIRVAAGVYEEWNLLLPDNVNIYGGYSGDPEVPERDFELYETRIDAKGHDHCIIIAHAGTNVPTTWIIDGLTLTGAYADASESWGVDLDGVSQDTAPGTSSNIGSEFGMRGGGIYCYCQPVVGETFGGSFPPGSVPPYLIVRNCFITNNRAKGLGGGFLLNRCGGLIEDCTVTLNSAVSGGGGALPESNDQGICTMRNVTFANNSTDGEWTGGGGVFMWKNRGTTTNCRFINNTSTKAWGGGVALDAASKQVFTNCLFAGNSAPKGAAMETGFFDDFVQDNSTATLINCTVADNTATAAGGAVWGQLSSRTTAINTIFHANATSAGYLLDPSAPMSISYCIIGTNTNPSGLFNSRVTTSNLVNGDPLFRSAGSAGHAGDYHLKSGSSAIGAALQSAAPLVDIEGTARSAPYDAGAYEFVPTPKASVGLGWGEYR